MNDDFAQRLGLSVEKDDLMALDDNHLRDLAAEMVEHDTLYSDFNVFYEWLKGGDDYWDDQFTSTAETALLDMYHPNRDGSMRDILHTYIRDTGEMWRLARDQGRNKITLFDPENTKALQAPRDKGLLDRLRGRAVMDHNTEVLNERLDGMKIRIPKVLSRGVAEVNDVTVPYDVARYESCIPFSEVESSYSDTKRDEIFERAKQASDIAQTMIDDGEVMYTSRNEFWKHNKPDNMKYHPESDSIVFMDRGEWDEPIHEMSKEDFIRRHDIDERAWQIAYDADLTDEEVYAQS